MRDAKGRRYDTEKQKTKRNGYIHTYIHIYTHTHTYMNRESIIHGTSETKKNYMK